MTEGGVYVETLWRLLANWDSTVGCVGGKANNFTSKESP